MPNHCTNFIRSPRLKELVPFLINPEGDVDFNLVAPMPAGMGDVTSGSALSTYQRSLGITGFYEFQTVEEAKERVKAFDAEALANCAKAHEYFKQTGFWSWYDWSIANWGTKWNAYESDVNDHEISFTTAWGPPEEFFQKLHTLTKIPFQVDWNEEGGEYGELSY